MPFNWLVLVAAVAGLALGAAAAYTWFTRIEHNKRIAAEQEAQNIIVMARHEAEDILREGRDEIARQREEMEKELARRRADLNREEDRQQRLNKRQSALDRQRNQLEELKAERMQALERVAEMTREEAREHLLALVEKETRNDMARRIREVEDELNAEANERARELIALAIQRVASDYVSDVTVSVVPLPNDEMKGRIIGRNGRNIRAFEQASGVDVIVDDT